VASRLPCLRIVVVVQARARGLDLSR